MELIVAYSNRIDWRPSIDSLVIIINRRLSNIRYHLHVIHYCYYYTYIFFNQSSITFNDIQ